MSKLQLFYDDSSDEEDKVTDYDVKTKFHKYRHDMSELYQGKIDEFNQEVKNIDEELQTLKAQLQSARDTRSTYDKGTPERKEANVLVEQLKKEEKKLEDTIIEAQKTIDKMNDKVSELQEEETHLLSFVSHAAGISVLYHPEVQKKYYELKKEKLTPGVELYSDDEIRERLKKITDKVVRWSRDTREKAKEFQQKISDKVNKVLEFKDEEVKWQWVNSSNEERNERIEALFRDIEIEPEEEIRNFNNNFDSRVLDFAKPNTRKVLASTDFDMSAIDPEDFVVEYLAYQRLHNRSEKRCLKNNDKCKDTTWKISDSVEIKLSNANMWPECRGEIVRFSQHDSIARYSEIMTLPGLDTKILESCYMNIKTSAGVLTSETASLWYLLFGCEAIKNPSAIVHHAMLIDLVRAGKCAWNPLEEVAPMASSESIQPAMFLNREYAEYMPVAYTYQPKSNFSEMGLRQRESKLMTEWLQLKLGEMGTTALLAICKKEPQVVDVLWSLIQNSFESWGMPMAVLQEQTNLLGDDSEIDV